MEIPTSAVFHHRRLHRGFYPGSWVDFGGDCSGVLRAGEDSAEGRVGAVVASAADFDHARCFDFAATTVLTLFSAVMAAMLLTLTTRLEALMNAVERMLQPFARFGLPVETITLAISLTIRLIPLQLATVKEVLDARKARGAGFSIAAFGTPVIIRSIKRARNIGDALLARGAGD